MSPVVKLPLAEVDQEVARFYGELRSTMQTPHTGYYAATLPRSKWIEMGKPLEVRITVASTDEEAS